MSAIIKRVEGKFVKKWSKSATCHSCGGGWAIAHSDGFGKEENEKYIGEKCDCGGTYVLDEDEWEEFVKGYVIVKCDCGNKISCHDSFLNTCSCGRDYNGSGQQLAPRSQWGEETGESLVDILNYREDWD